MDLKTNCALKRKKHKNLHSISAEAVFAWLDVLCDSNDLFAKRTIQFNEREAIIAMINDLNNTAKSAAVVTSDLKVSKLDEVKEGDRFRSDGIEKNESCSDDEMLIREVCLVNCNECFSNGTESMTKDLINSLKLKEAKKESKSMGTRVWPLERGDEPFREWTNKAHIATRSNG